MGEFIAPNSKSIEGPWIIDKSSLEELDEVLLIIKEKFDELFDQLVEEETEKELVDLKRWDKNADLKKAREKVTKQYHFKDDYCRVVLISKNRNKIIDDSLISLIKDPKVEEFKPYELEIQLKKGPYEVELVLSTGFLQELKIRINSPSHQIYSDVMFELNKWIGRNKSSYIVEKWSNMYPFIAFPVLVLFLILNPLFSQSKSDLYKQKLFSESHDLIQDGLSSENLERAIEIIIKLDSGYVPDDFEPEYSTNKSGTFRLLFIAGILILFIRPRSTIGIGKHEWISKFYKGWIKFIIVFIPLYIIVPIIINRYF